MSYCIAKSLKTVIWRFFHHTGNFPAGSAGEDITDKERRLQMAKLYYYYGAMGSSKTANALMTRFNYEETGKNALLCKPGLDTRDGEAYVRSRMGLGGKCVFLEELVNYTEEQIRQYQCIIVDEVQFAEPEQIDFLSDIVDFLNIPVICYGLRADFQNRLFPGSERLIAIADCVKELKTVCWCGKKATCNARYNENGIVREGEQVMLGSNDKYIALCRKHFKEGKLRPDFSQAPCNP